MLYEFKIRSGYIKQNVYVSADDDETAIESAVVRLGMSRRMFDEYSDMKKYDENTALVLRLTAEPFPM